MYKKGFALYLFSALLLGNAPSFAAETVFNVNGTISPSNDEYDGTDLVVDGAVVEISGEHGFSSVTLRNNAVLTHPAGYAGGLSLIVTGDVDIESGSFIDVSEKGYGLVPGITGGGSASHGGTIALPDGDTTNPTYGSITEPTELGSGTVAPDGPEAVRGGGSVKLIAENLYMNGSILADGASTPPAITENGGASGGSIWIQVNNIIGEAGISASGGYGYTHGGCGGRVSIFIRGVGDLKPWQVRVWGGTNYDSKFPSEIVYAAGSGTYYLYNESSGVGRLKAFNSSYGGGMTEIYDVSVETLEIAGNVILNGLPSEIGNVSSDQYQYYPAYLTIETLPTPKGDELIFGNGVNVYPVVNLDWAGSHVVIDDDASIRTFYDIGGKIEVISDVLDVRGWIGAEGASYLVRDGITAGSGASHGGLGGVVNGGTTNRTYGDPLFPQELGSESADRGSDRGYHGAGGAIKIKANTLNLDGVVTANGRAGGRINDDGLGAGGASGGSIWLDVGTLSGDGEIRADGGSGGSGGNGGGGGRIAIHYLDNSGFSFTDLYQVHANGGAAGYAIDSQTPVDGGDGTIEFINPSELLKVTSSLPVGVVSEEVSSIVVNFNAPLKPVSFLVDDVKVIGPEGELHPTSIEPVNSVTYQINFSPPLSHDGHYSLSIGPDLLSAGGAGMDQNDNGVIGEGEDDAYKSEFYIDTEPPAPPVVTNYNVESGLIYVKTSPLIIEGSRDSDSEVWLNNELIIAGGSNGWSYPLNLDEGSNSISLTLRDSAGNFSVPLNFILFKDDIPPVLTSSSPSNNEYINIDPDNIVIQYDERGSGIDLGSVDFSVTRDGVAEPGAWVIVGESLKFAPVGAFVDGIWRVTGQVVDKAGLASVPIDYSFTLDRQKPAKPVVAPYPSATQQVSHNFHGTTEPNTIVLINDSQINTPSTENTEWELPIWFFPGDNVYEIVSEDLAGNRSEPVIVTVYYDDTPPDAVTVVPDGRGDGTSVRLDWSAYDEHANGDVVKDYAIYKSNSPFNVKTDAELVGTVPAGIKSYTARALTRDNTYYFAVVAADVSGNALSDVTPVNVTTEDIEPPSQVQNLHLAAFEDHLMATWMAPIPVADDLAGYQVYLDGVAYDPLLSSDTLSYKIPDLEPATGYRIKVKAVDGSSNMGPALELQGATLLTNPVDVTPTGLDTRVALSWSAVTPSDLVSKYAVYVQSGPFDDVTGMTPSAVVAGTHTTAQVAGLTNDTDYYVAVTTINISGGELPTVTSQLITPAPDEAPPEITSVTFDGDELADGTTLAHKGRLAVAANDPSGVGRVAFLLDGSPLAEDVNGSDGFGVEWDVATTTDASHELTVVAYDVLDNAGSKVIPLTVALAPPDAPVIKAPANNLKTNDPAPQVSGTVAPQTEVRLMRDGALVAGPVTSGLDGRFTLAAPLVEGENILTAVAHHPAGRGEDSPASTPLTITLDTTIPDAPLGLAARAQAGGVVVLTWNTTGDKRVVGYRVYRATSSFSETAVATVANTADVTRGRFDDVPPADGEYFYRVVALNDLVPPTESALSNQVSATSDSELPYAVSIEYTPSGRHDPATGRMAPGPVQVAVTVNEPLLTAPFLSITPNGGVPMPVQLAKTDDTHYTGHFDIEPTTVSATAHAVFSARDRVGNGGTEVLAGRTIEIDTDGPMVTSLAVLPGDPIKTDLNDPTSITVAITLDHPVAPGTAPQLQYLLSGADRQATEISGLKPQNDVTWRGTFTLPANAGETAVETLQFLFSAVDDLDNAGTDIQGPNRFQVYQGELPPAEIPRNLTATALPGGQVALNWSAVTDAATYLLYRQGPNESALSELPRSVETTFIDDTPEDGDYRYAVASVRQANGQERISQQSETKLVTADREAPSAPVNLSAELTGSGVVLQWDPAPDAGPETLSYRVYRNGGTVIDDVSALTPIAEHVVANAELLLGYLDGTPLQGEGAYTVTAVDAAGNESVPAISTYKNIDLLPVTSLQVRQADGDYPMLSWTHPVGSIAGYNIYLATDTITPLNSELLQTPSYQDLGYTGGVRDYIVKAVDDLGAESEGREIALIPITATRSADSQLKRGIFNRLSYEVSNLTERAVSGVQLRLTVAGQPYRSASFDLAAGEVREVEVVVGGLAGLPGVADLQEDLQVTQSTGEQVTLSHSDSIAVGDDTLLVRLEAGELTRGTPGKIRFILENTSAVDTEVLMARSTSSASDQVQLVLSDTDQNRLSTAWVNQAANDVIGLPDGRVVARIPAGDSFTSAWQSLPIPPGAPDDVQVQLAIGQLHYDLGGAGEASIGGPSARLSASLVDTPYTATVDNVAPDNTFGDEPIVITGQALDRAAGTPLANVPVKLVLASKGFEQVETVTTDAAGSYSYSYRPKANASGVYTVSAIHPAMFTRPGQRSFTLNRILVSPTTLNVKLGRNYTHSLNLIKVSTGAATTASNVRLVYDPADQSGGEAPAGVTLVPGSAVTVGPDGNKGLPFTLSADNTAQTSGTLKLKVYADETGTAAPLAVAYVNYTFVAAEPALTFSPNFVETGVAQGGTVNEVITLENRGLAEMLDVNLALVDEAGAPAPDWLHLASAASQGDLAVGDKRAIQITAVPDATVAENNYRYKLRVTSANHDTTDINLFVYVNQSGEGGMVFHASDIYTATLDANNNLIQGVAGATIRAQNEANLLTYTADPTDADGVTVLPTLPAGRYRYRASAPNHQDVLGSFTIKPGVTGGTEVFLDYNLVTVEWSVTEIPLQDKYEITLQALFETDVPAAVVVMEPASTTLPVMAVGDVFYGEIRLTNHGLIRTNDLNFQLPQSDAYYRYELLADLPVSLDAKESVLIPYRVTAIAAIDPDGADSGGGCVTYTKVMRCTYHYQCANGTDAGSSTRHTWTRAYDPKGCNDPVSISKVVHYGSGGGTSGGGVSSGSSSYQSLGGAQCMPSPVGKSCPTFGGRDGGR